jgi:hypothetical protein
MVLLRKIQSQLCLGAIALGSSLAIALPTRATVPQDPLILFEVEQITDEGYNPPTFYIRGEQTNEQIPVGPVPPDWLGPDGQLKTNPHHPDILPSSPIAPAGTTSDPLQQQEVLDQY